MLYNTLIGCLIFVINNSALLYTAHLVVRRFFPHAPPSVRLVTIGVLFYALIILLLQALSPFYAITKTWSTVSCLLIALVAHFLWGKLKNLNADIEPIKIWLRDGLNSRWAALIIICGFVVLLSFSRALLMPPLAWDCLTYHLTFAALWIKTGALVLFKAPDQIQGCAHLPINGELFAAWFLLPFHSDLIVNTMNFPITLLGGISCYAIGRELGLSRKEASFAPALICFAPVIYAQITTQYVDNTVFAFCTAAVLFTLRYLREGHPFDNFIALATGGILLGTKYTGIPAFGLIFIVTAIKTLSLTNYPKVKKGAVIFLGILIVCCLGGRKYIQNTIEAGNPLYPFSLKVFHYEIFAGYPKLEEEKELISERVKEEGLDQLSFWESEFIKFSYREVTAGPKFLLLFFLGCIALFARPPNVPARGWLFLSVIWAVPLAINYLDSSADVARIGGWVESSTRYVSPFIALFTIQGLFVIQRIEKLWSKVDILLVVLVIWDLLHVRTNHSVEIEASYPLLIPLLISGFICFIFVQDKAGGFSQKERICDNPNTGANGWSFLRRNSSIRKGFVFVITFLVFVGSLHLFTIYRDNTRYVYYRSHEDFHYLPRDYVSAWDFLDKEGETSTIAMARGWKPESHEWFFYPLLGKNFQNDIVYISAKYKWETPTWLDRGLLRGEDLAIWMANLKKKRVDYILVVKPWPIELTWLRKHPDTFQLVFTSHKFKIFRHKRKTT
jgi:hypothetical protein